MTLLPHPETSPPEILLNPDPVERLIIALDVPTLAAATALIEQLPQVRWWKVGLELFIRDGAAVLSLLHQQNKRIFLDLKLHDIPNTVAGAVRSAVAYEVDLLTIHGCGGIPMLKAAAQACEDSPCQLLAVTLLTSITAAQLSQELRVTDPVPAYIQHLAEQAQEAGIPGAVCSPHEAALLRRVCGDDFVLVTPGIRLRADNAGDQARVWTPTAALTAGANRLVVGRPITQAPDPQHAWQQWCHALAL